MKTKILAVLAVLAMAFAGVAVITEAQQNDATGIAGDYQIAAYAVDAKGGSETATDYYGLRAVLYEDKVLMLDTNDVLSGTGKKIVDAGTFKVTLQAPTSTAAKAVVIPQVPSVNGKIYLDLDGIADADSKPLLAAGDLVITLNAYGSDAVYGNVTMALTTATIAAVTNGLTLKTNHNADWSEANKKEGTGTGEITYVAPVTNTGSRNAMICMDDSATSSVFKDPHGLYVLKGWGLDFEGDIVIYPAESMSIEEIVYAIADSGANIDFTDTITLYAIYTKTSFSLTIQDQANSDDTKWTFVSSEATLKLDADKSKAVVASASITSNVTSDSFALLKIAQKTTLGQYVYKFDGTDGKVEKYDRATQTWSNATLGTDYKVKMIANGIYQITEVKSDLRFTVKAVSTDAASTTAYNFAIDDIKNPVTSGHANGTVELSLDLYDYTIDSDQHYITLDGTYYRSVGDNVRIYGNIDSLGDAKKTWASYIDLKATSDTDGVLSLTETNSVYDLRLTLDDDLSIYAAQGLWHQKDAVEDPAADAVELTTPWSLYKA